MSSKKQLLEQKMSELVNSKPTHTEPTAPTEKTEFKGIKPMSLDDIPIHPTPTEQTEEKPLNYEEFSLPNPNPKTDLKGKRYKVGEPLHTVRYSFQITEELLEDLNYYLEYAKRHGREINQSVLMREALAKTLKKEPKG